MDFWTSVNQLVGEGRSAEAIPVLERVPLDGPEGSEAMAYRGYLVSFVQGFLPAHELLEAALKSGRAAEPWRLHHALGELQERFYKDLLQDIQESDGLNHLPSEVEQRRGTLRKMKHNAVRRYRSAYQLAPAVEAGVPEAYLRVLLLGEENDEAVRVGREVVAAHRATAEALAHIAVAHGRVGDLEVAAEMLKLAEQAEAPDELLAEARLELATARHVLAQPGPPGTTGDTRVDDLRREGNLRAARALLDASLRRWPLDVDLHQDRANLDRGSGRVPWSAVSLRAAAQLEGLGPEDRAALCFTAGLHFAECGAHGSTVKLDGNSVLHMPIGERSDHDRRYRDECHERAAACFADTALHTGRPQPEAQRRRADALLELGRAAEALAALDSVPSGSDWEVEHSLARTAALEQLGRLDEALAEVESALVHDRQRPALWARKAALLEARGDDAGAVAARREGEVAAHFAVCDPPTGERALALALALLSEDTEPHELDGLLAEAARLAPDDRAAVYAACLHAHVSHEHEDQLFATLTGERRSELLLRLLERAQSVCTAKGAFAGLTSLRHPRIFELLVMNLEKDVHAFPMDVADCLARLGDERAVPHLIEVMERAPAPGSSSSPFAFASDRNREACAVALGRFSTPEAIEALESHLGHSLLGPACALGRYLQTGEERYREEAARCDHPEAPLSLDDDVG